MLRRVHAPAFVDHLATIHAEWMEGPYDELVGQDRVVPYVFPTAAMTQGMPPTRAAATHGRAGQFGYDTMTLVGPGTWEAARAAVDCALTAADLVARGGETTAYALCRPPGHHATRDGYGGSCYLNNAAVAAAGAARRRARRRWRSSTSTPTTATGRRRSSGSAATSGTARSTSTRPPDGSRTTSATPTRPAPGPGEGATRNLPLAEGTGDGPWLEAVRELGRLRGGCRRPGGVARASTPPRTTPRARCRSPPTGTPRPAGCSARSVLPAVVVQEGGYHLDTIGGLVAAYLDGHAG